MPFDSSGKYSLPSIYKATTGEKVLAEQHNIPLEDIAQALALCLKRDGSTPAIRNLSMSGFQITDLGDARNPGDGVSRKLLDAAVPVGAISQFAGDNPPQGWLLCCGQEVSRTLYSTLFEVIGTRFGAGDGGSTFNLPDFRGRTGVGRDNMGGAAAGRVTIAASGIEGTRMGAAGGGEAHRLSAGEIAAHSHEVTGTTSYDGQHIHYGVVAHPGGNGSLVGGGNAWHGQSQPAGSHVHQITGTAHANNGGEAHNNMQPSIVVNYIIRTGA